MKNRKEVLVCGIKFIVLFFLTLFYSGQDVWEGTPLYLAVKVSISIILISMTVFYLICAILLTLIQFGRKS